MTVNITLSRAPETTPPETDPVTEPLEITTDPSEPPVTDPSTEPVEEGYVDWTLLLPQGLEYPDQFFLEIYVDDVVSYANTVEKSAGSVTLRIRGTGTVRVEAYIDTTLYKTEMIPIT